MKDEKCFYFVQKDKNGHEFAVTGSTVDLYAPKTTGVFNVFMDLYKQGNKNQQWGYNVAKKQIYSIAHPSAIFTQGGNNNLFLFGDRGLKNQQFMVDLEKNWVLNEFTGLAMTQDKPDPKESQNALNVVMDKHKKSSE